MRKTLLFSIVLACSFTAVAQQNPAVIVIQPSAGMSCPVGFSIAADSRFTLRTAESGEKNNTLASLDLTFQQLDQAKLRTATVKVHGVSGANRLLRTAADEDQVQTLELRGDGDSGLEFQQVSLDSVRFVHWAEITEATYADGTTWRPSQRSTCRANINGLKLVGF